MGYCGGPVGHARPSGERSQVPDVPFVGLVAWRWRVCCAKRTQFWGAGMNANCFFSNGLEGNVRIPQGERTKPMCRFRAAGAGGPPVRNERNRRSHRQASLDAATRTLAQNKPNSGLANFAVTAYQKEVYDEEYALCPRANKANVWPACLAKQTQFRGWLNSVRIAVASARRVSARACRRGIERNLLRRYYNRAACRHLHRLACSCAKAESEGK